MRTVVRSLQLHSSNEDVQIAGMRCLRLVAMGSKAVCSELLSSGVIATCMVAFARHGGSPGVCAWTCAVLKGIAWLGENAQNRITQAGAVNRVIAILRQQMFDATIMDSRQDVDASDVATSVRCVVLEQGLAVLQNICASHECKLKMAALGAIGVIVKVVVWACDGANSPGVPVTGLKALYNLLADDQIKDTVRRFYKQQLRHVFDVSDPTTHYGGVGSPKVRYWCTKVLVRAEIIDVATCLAVTVPHSSHNERQRNSVGAALYRVPQSIFCWSTRECPSQIEVRASAPWISALSQLHREYERYVAPNSNVMPAAPPCGPVISDRDILHLRKMVLGRYTQSLATVGDREVLQCYRHQDHRHIVMRCIPDFHGREARWGLFYDIESTVLKSTSIGVRSRSFPLTQHFDNVVPPHQLQWEMEVANNSWVPCSSAETGIFVVIDLDQHDSESFTRALARQDALHRIKSGTASIGDLKLLRSNTL